MTISFREGIIPNLILFASALISVLHVVPQSAFAQSELVEITGELQKWHPITFTLTGPSSSETAEPNPFFDYRFEVTFKNEGKAYRVPGYFAADGDAANTSATSGDKWQARFVPDRTGEWTYEIAFRTGENIAVADDISLGEPNEFNGLTGSFIVEETDKSGVDFRGRGILRQVGEHYLLFDSGEWFLINGAGSPETFLAYAGFDNTFSQGEWTPKTYTAHIDDWTTDDPTWGTEQGKGIIGAVNYLSEVGVNSMYLIVMNTGGDGQDTFPWLAHEDFYHYDVSKLAQWGIVFEHMNQKGIMPHLVLQEMHNDYLLDNGELGVERKAFYRELFARFGYLNGITWNIGEEHRPPANGGNTNAQRMDFVNFLTELEPYGHPIVMHTSAGVDNYNALFDPFLGHPRFGGMSYHIHGMENQGQSSGAGNDTYRYARVWRDNSAFAGRKWIVTLDECCGWDSGVRPDQSNLESVRKDEMWGTLMAGVAGFNWYFGFDIDVRDLTLEDFRRYDFLWETSNHSVRFFRNYLPFADMEPVDGLTLEDTTRVLARPGEIYAVYLPNGDSTTLNLEAYADSFNVKWYNPREGGPLQSGTIDRIVGPGEQFLGRPPADPEDDWVLLIRRAGMANTLTARINSRTSDEPFTVEFDGSTSTSSDAEVVSYEWDLGDGSVVDIPAVKYTYASAGIYTVQLTITDALGNTARRTQTVAVKHPTEMGPFLEEDGLLVIEAEHFEENVPRNGEAWVVDRANEGFEGTGAVVGMPDRGGFYGFKYSLYSPHLTYQADFSTADTFFVWLRVKTDSSESNSIHVGLDGIETDTGEAMETNTFYVWHWINARGHEAGPAYLIVEEAGEHTIDLWMREDGFYIDRLLLTTDASYVPADEGLQESLRTGVVPQIALTAEPTSGMAPLTVNFDASGSTAPFGTTLRYSWDFGDGTIGTGVSIEHTYETTGTYTATLTVEASNGNSVNADQVVSATPVPATEVHVASVTSDVRVESAQVKYGRVAISISDEHQNPVSGVAVTGIFYGNVNGTASGVTDASGVVVLESNPTGFDPAAVNFCVTEVSHVTLAYNPNANADAGFTCDINIILDNENEAAFPTEYALGNYPNPFKNATNITIDLPEAGDISLKVYNVLGQEVTTLIEGPLRPGSHTAVFDVNGLSSGLYIYTLEANGRRISKTMLVL